MDTSSAETASSHTMTRGLSTSALAIPKSWRSVTFKRLRTYGGLLVSLKLRAGRISAIEFNSRQDMTLKIKDSYGISALIGVEPTDGFITLDIKKGRTKFV